MQNYQIKQNSPELVSLLKASTVAYKNAKSREFAVTYILLFLAAAYPISYIFIKDESSKQLLFGLSFFVTITTWFLTDYFKGNTAKGALLKEQFDVLLFGLPWKFMLPKPDMSEVVNLEKEYSGEDIKDWYPANISETMPQNTVVAICQRISSSWDIELRSKYKTFLSVFLFAYTLLVFMLWVIKSVDGRTVFLLYFSTLSFYSHINTLIRGNANAIKKRTTIVAKLDEYINNRKLFTQDNLRDIQDEIYNIRQEPAKVPDFYFKLYNKRIKNTLEVYVQMVNKIYP